VYSWRLLTRSLELIQIVYPMLLLKRRKYDYCILKARASLMPLPGSDCEVSDCGGCILRPLRSWYVIFLQYASTQLTPPTIARRREYDALLASRAYSERSTSADASANFFSNFANMFQGASTASGSAHAEPKEEPEEPFERPDAEATFGNIFEEVSSHHVCLIW
jgi:hypothetical protein